MIVWVGGGRVAVFVKLNAGQFRGKSVLDRVSDEVVAAALKETRGNITDAAKLLGIYRQTLQRRLRGKR